MKYSITHSRHGESKMSDPCICGTEKKGDFCKKNLSCSGKGVAL